MGDACCDTDDHDAGLDDDAPVTVWAITEVRLAAASGLLLVAGLAANGTPADVLFLAALAVGGWTFIPESLRNLPKGRLGVGTLMTIAAIGAVALESSAKRRRWRSCSRSPRRSRATPSPAPDAASRAARPSSPSERPSAARGPAEIDPADLAVGDLLVVGPGERVATDGVIRTGRSTLDLSAITGESLPVEVGAGEHVLRGGDQRGRRPRGRGHRAPPTAPSPGWSTSSRTPRNARAPANASPTDRPTAGPRRHGRRRR